MSGYLIASADRKKVALENNNHSGVFMLTQPMPAKLDSISYLMLPQDAKKIGSGSDAFAVYRDIVNAIQGPSPEDWDKARSRHTCRYEADHGIAEEWYWIGKDLDGAEFPCRDSRWVGGY